MLCIQGVVVYLFTNERWDQNRRTLVVGNLHAAVNFVRQPTLSLVDAWMVQAVNTTEGRVAYGSVRLWGSVGWAVACLIMTKIADCGQVLLSPSIYVGSSVYPWRSGIPCWSKTAAALQPEEENAEPVDHINPFVLFKNYYFVWILIFNLILTISSTLPSTLFRICLPKSGADQT